MATVTSLRVERADARQVSTTATMSAAAAASRIPHTVGDRCAISGNSVRTSFFHFEIFLRRQCRAEQLDPVKKEKFSSPGWQEPRGGEASQQNSLLSGKRMRKPYCKPWVFRPRATSHPCGTIRSSRKHMASYSAGAATSLHAQHSTPLPRLSIVSPCFLPFFVFLRRFIIFSK